jgi:hypothetical protein
MVARLIAHGIDIRLCSLHMNKIKNRTYIIRKENGFSGSSGNNSGGLLNRKQEFLSVLPIWREIGFRY